jgi:hypothetical protein
MLEALEARKAKDSVVSNVSPKWWERALGGLSAGAMAFGRVPGAVAAGQSVTGRGQIAAEKQRLGRLAADEVGIQAWNDGQKRAQQDFENQNTAFNDNERAISRRQLDSDRAAQERQRLQAVAPGTEQPDDPNNTLGRWHATTVGGSRVALQGPPDKWAKSPAGVAAQRDADVKRLGLTGDDAKFYRANGKLKEPTPQTNIRIPSAESEEWSAYVRSLGHAPTTDDVINFKRNAPNTSGGRPIPPATAARISDTKNKAMQAAQKGLADGVLDKTQARDALQAAQDQYEQAIEAAGGTVNHMTIGDDLTWKAASDTGNSTKSPKGTASTPVSAPQPKKAPQPGTRLTDRAIAKQYLEAAGGDLKKAREAAARDGWEF